MRSPNRAQDVGSGRVSQAVGGLRQPHHSQGASALGSRYVDQAVTRRAAQSSTSTVQQPLVQPIQYPVIRLRLGASVSTVPKTLTLKRSRSS